VFPSGGVSSLSGPGGSVLARHIAGLDRSDHLRVTFNERLDQPKTAYIGDDFIGLQGSLRRVATLLSRKRPDDRRIQEVLAAYGLDHLLKHERGLDTRVAEAGRTLTTDETLRLDLARAELGKVRLLILDSVRLRASPHRRALVEMFSKRCDATILVVEGSKQLMHPATRPEPHGCEIYNAV
jgi:ABC-type transport system involved in cytochrome bd biosynthesis fused ATPase/permease subunit